VFSEFCFLMSCCLGDNAGNCQGQTSPQMWQYNTAHALCVLDNLKLQAHTQNMWHILLSHGSHCHANASQLSLLYVPLAVRYIAVRLLSPEALTVSIDQKLLLSCGKNIELKCPRCFSYNPLQTRTKCIFKQCFIITRLTTCAAQLNGVTYILIYSIHGAQSFLES
jgi:phage FluMu protein Com